ncbi:RNA pseudouridine synthase 7-like [Eucalyptus grandis]|uniref:RNA pseudouridine synthase 7-like n=1 Tax=Eucalyptus grandis TaxID=71139 RepID=UPI00192EBC6F|nr:RNA pseudouridine synthase 7-like [Eucalyptus grandis]
MVAGEWRGIERKEEGEIVWQTLLNPPESQDYIFREGRRYVAPYHFEFISHVSAAESGPIQVEGRVVPVSYIVKPSEKISHFVHRHEPPVISHGVSILQKELNVVTVYKPASIPYRKNTVVSILPAEQGLAPLFPVHQLDRLVSGLLIFARNASKADLLRQQIEGGLMQKQYIAKVVGEFPENELEVNVNINYNAREGRSTVEAGDPTCDTALLKGRPLVHSSQGSAPMEFIALFSVNQSLEELHQIRVHLQFSGHPIANDMIYLSEQRTSHSAEGMVADKAAGLSSESSVSDIGQNEKEEEPCIEFSTDPMCTNCPNLAPKGYDGNEEGLWLHYIQYSGPEWIYECPYPDWASLG